ncbi:MAG: peptidoglycan-binding domain-containing protein [Cognatishimia sp.]
MAFKHISAAILAASIAQPAAANDFLGGVVGGLIGGAIVSEANKNKRRPVYSGVSASVRQERRDIQTSLNYFGYPAGTPDGVLGKRSRAAIASYQAFLGYPATGQLSEFEKNILIGAYHRAIAGGADVNRLIARDANGVKAVLIAQRDDMSSGTAPGARRTAGYAGLPYEVSVAVDEIADSSDPSAEQLLQRSGFIQLADLNGDGNNDYILDTSFAGSSFWCNATQCKTLVFASSATGYVRNDLLLHNPTPASFDCIGPNCRVSTATTQMASAPAPVLAAPVEAPATTAVAAPAFPALPLFQTEAANASLTTHCSKVNLLTNANGGFTTVSTLGDPDFALSEQLCLARTYAIAEGDAMIAKVSGVSATQIEQQCEGLGTTLKEHVSALSLKDSGDVVRDVSGFVLKTGMSPAQLAGTAKICLATGYRTDNLDTAIASGLLLVALGNRPYAELMGHHLSQGFGASVRKDLAVGWYGVALDALSAGATPVFATTQPERTDLIQQATFALSGGNTAGAATPESTSLPVFSVTE